MHELYATHVHVVVYAASSCLPATNTLWQNHSGCWGFNCPCTCIWLVKVPCVTHLKLATHAGGHEIPLDFHLCQTEFVLKL